MKLTELETPALILKKDVFERNITRMSQLCSRTGIALRPHYKSNKCLHVVKAQLAAGAKGITCAKLSEAEDLAAGGVQDILIANQVVQPCKLARLAHLAKACRLTVCADCEENIIALEKAAAAADSLIHVYIEFDIGMDRCGVATFEEAEALARLVAAQPHLDYNGIQAYAGHLSHECDYTQRRAEADRYDGILRDLKAYLTEKGLAPREISGCSTGTVLLKEGMESAYTELQAGSYVFMDASYAHLELPFEHSLFVLATVISTARGHVIADAGTKSVGSDQGPPLWVGFGDAVVSLSEEHGQIVMPEYTGKINDKIYYIPGHCCTTVNLYDKLYLVDGDEVCDVWPIVSRGKNR